MGAVKKEQEGSNRTVGVGEVERVFQKEEQERKGTLQKLQFSFQQFLHPLPNR